MVYLKLQQMDIEKNFIQDIAILPKIGENRDWDK